MFVSKYAPAHKFNRVAAFWQSPVIPNRPHLTDEANNNQRYDILHIGTVESAHLVVPDLGRSSWLLLLGGHPRRHVPLARSLRR